MTNLVQLTLFDGIFQAFLQRETTILMAGMMPNQKFHLQGIPWTMDAKDETKYAG